MGDGGWWLCWPLARWGRVAALARGGSIIIMPLAAHRLFVVWRAARQGAYVLSTYALYRLPGAPGAPIILVVVGVVQAAGRPRKGHRRRQQSPPGCWRQPGPDGKPWCIGGVRLGRARAAPTYLTIYRACRCLPQSAA